MKSGKRIVGAALLALLLAACGKPPEQEERIRISIDQPAQPGAPAGDKPQPKAAARPAPVRPAPAPAPAATPAPAPAAAPVAPVAVVPAPAPTPAPPAATRPARPAPPPPPPSAPPPAPPRPPQVAPAPPRPAPAALDFASVARRLTVDGADRRAVRKAWDEVHEQTVVWSGSVVEVEAGRRGFRVLVLDPSAGTRERFNLILLGGDAATARTLSPGQGVRFRGVIHRAEFGSPRRGAVVTLREVAFL
jgi:hypothetical protein